MQIEIGLRLLTTVMLLVLFAVALKGIDASQQYKTLKKAVYSYYSTMPDGIIVTYAVYTRLSGLQYRKVIYYWNPDVVDALSGVIYPCSKIKQELSDFIINYCTNFRTADENIKLARKLELVGQFRFMAITVKQYHAESFLSRFVHFK
jgi:hypothetical protein